MNFQLNIHIIDVLEMLFLVLFYTFYAYVVTWYDQHKINRLKEGFAMRHSKIKKIALSTILALVIFFSSFVTQASAIAYNTVPSGVVCLTIDGGYGMNYITTMLTILRDRNIKCTFFIIGRQLKAYPALWRQAIADGHEICYQSMGDYSMNSWSNAKIMQDLNLWNKTSKEVLGQGYEIPKLARLPGGSGHKNQRILNLFASLGYHLVGWNVDTYTGAIKPRRSISQYIKTKTTIRSIILIHFNSPDTKAVPEYIDWLNNKFTLEKVSNALNLQLSTSTPIPTSSPTPKPTPTPQTTPKPTTPKPTLTATPVKTQPPYAQPAYRMIPKNQVSLTIDDGYGRSYITTVLNLLRAKNVDSTFFVIGNQLKAYPDLWRQAIMDGHEICYHSMNHYSMGSWSNTKIIQDLNTWNKTAKDVLGHWYTIPKLARLPGGSGHTNSRILLLFNSIGYKVIGWNVDTYTGAIRPKRSISRYIVDKTVPGSIVLTHFNSLDSRAMADYIDFLKNKFMLVKVSDALFPSPIPAPTVVPSVGG